MRCGVGYWKPRITPGLTDRKELINLLSRFSILDGPYMYDLDEVELGQDLWLEAATEESFRLLFDIVLHPPDWNWSRGRMPDHWEDAPSRMLGEWGRRNPEVAIRQLGSLLSNSNTRAIALSSLYEVGHPVVIPYLKPLIKDWDQLNDDELMLLIDAFWQTRHIEAVLPLKQLQTLIPVEKTELHREIILALAHTEKVGVEPGGISTLKN